MRTNRVSRAQWLGIAMGISALVVLLDIVTGPYIYFPVLFVVPVGLAAWFLGRNAAFAIALGLVAARFWVAITFEVQYLPLWAALLNAGIRLVVFLGVAYLMSLIASQHRELEHRVQELEGILPICSFCKKIRNESGKWEQLENYVTQRSAAEFSHSVCTECEHVHYGEYARAGHA